MILSIGALLIFGTFLSSSNRLMIGNTQIAEQNEYYISAVSLAQAIIDEAKTKAFDQKTDTSAVAIPDSLTNPVKLGTEGTEATGLPKPDTLTSASPYTATSRGYRSTYRFNDVDDYDGYTRLVNTQRAENFRIRVRVNYAIETDPDFLTMTRTYCKRMIVTVSSPYLFNDVQLSYAFTY